MTRIAELQDRLRRLAKRREGEGIYTDAAICEEAAEALSRTGAVKVKALEWEERKTRLGTVWWSAPNPLGGLSIEAASENDKIAAQADFEHRILSALEPAAPEGRHDEDAYDAEMRAIEVSINSGARRSPRRFSLARPAEQAVTEAIQEIIRQLELTGPTRSKHCDRQTLADELRAALKAAMEAGRHD